MKHLGRLNENKSYVVITDGAIIENTGVRAQRYCALFLRRRGDEDKAKNACRYFFPETAENFPREYYDVPCFQYDVCFRNSTVKIINIPSDGCDGHAIRVYNVS